MDKLQEALNLEEVSHPLVLPSQKGINDDLNGVKQAVSFYVPSVQKPNWAFAAEVVQACTKWKRLALERFGFQPGTGLVAYMTAIRKDTTMGNVHSVSVHQWDWEMAIDKQQRNQDFLYGIVRKIWSVIRETHEMVSQNHPKLAFDADSPFPRDITFLSSEELYNRYPNIPARQREVEATKEHGAIFLRGYGWNLPDGKPQDERAPDYDDWNLNGDILVWNPVLKTRFELSSMGIRVDSETMMKQLKHQGLEGRSCLFYHEQVLNNKVPLSIGGGIGRSRLFQYLLRTAHVGEVVMGAWPEPMVEECARRGIELM